MQRRAKDRVPTKNSGFLLLVRMVDSSGAETAATGYETDSGSGGLSIDVYV
jgi:hypothetical protein